MPEIDLSIIDSADDCVVHSDGSIWVLEPLTSAVAVVGYAAADYLKMGTGFRFQNVTIPQGAIITKAHLTIYAFSTNAGTVVNSRITGDDEDDAAAWTSIGDFQTRRGTIVGGADDTKITTAQVDWDGIASWTAESAYDSPDIAAVIQEIINRAGWESGNSLALWWDDYDARGTQGAGAYRQGASFDHPTLTAPVLHIEYSVPLSATVTTQAMSSVVDTTATGNGNVTILGAPAANQHGHCWNTTGTPTTSDDKTENGVPAATGAFTSSLTGLTPGTLYYVRAYVTSALGTSYGEEVSFVTEKHWYRLNIKNINLPYEDKDKTKELHMLLKNLSPTSKEAGADGEVVIEVKYEPAA